MRVAQVDVAIISVGTRGLAAYRAARAAGDTDRNGVVWLSGTANSQQEADKAVEIARNTEGVKSVNSKLKVRKDR